MMSATTMEFQRSNKSKKKGKQVMADSVNQRKEDTIRDPNWTVDETTHLLNAVQQIQTRRGRVGFNFTTLEKQEIFRLFKESLPMTTREKGKLLNRLKVITQMFKACKDLANRSGGGWDDVLQRPIAPSEAEYVEMVMARGDTAKFLLRNNFPWYHQMLKMVGGQSARGDVEYGTYPNGTPIHCLMSSQMSIQGSEQGSSDDPDEGNPKDDWGAGSSYPMGGQSSDASVPKSGSKRKSTDESSEPSSKGKRYKERYRKKAADNERLADAACEIARCLREDIEGQRNKEDEIKKCLRRFKEFGIVDSYHDFCMSYMDNNYRREWFLENEKTEVFKWIKRNIQRTVYNPIPMPPNHDPSQEYGQSEYVAFNQGPFMNRPPRFG